MIRFLLNPASGGGKGQRARDELERLASTREAELLVSRDADDLVLLASEAAEEGVGRLVVAGGDGTFHHVAQGLTGSRCAMGLVPLGRGNDLATTLGIPASLPAAVELAVGGPVREIDVGRLGGRSFLGYCGVGFDSEVACLVHEKGGLFKGPFTYVYGVLRTLATFEPPTITVEHDDGRFEGKAMFVVVCNHARFGGGMLIAPKAKIDDGVLDLVIAEKLSKFELLRVFPKVYRGEHVDHPALKFHRSRRVRIALDRTMTMATDGEPLLTVGEDGIEVTVRPGSLRVVAP